MTTRATISVLLGVLALTILSPAGVTADYTILYLEKGDYFEWHPRISDNGDVVWMGRTLDDYEIYLFDGNNVTQPTNNDYNDMYPQINAHGHVAWSGEDIADFEIFLYDGSGISQLTHNDYDDEDPQIGDGGHVVWTGCGPPSCEVFLYNGVSTIQVTNNLEMDLEPQVNVDGHVVWFGCDTSDCGTHGDGDFEIFLYDGTSTMQITDNDFYDGEPQIGDNGHVAWHAYPNAHSWPRIFLYDGADITQITTNDLDARNYRLNNNGKVVWQECDTSDCSQGGDGDYEIFLYDGSSTTRITNNDHHDEQPTINDDDLVVWYGHGRYPIWQDIFFYDGSTVTQIETNEPAEGSLQVNNGGYIAGLGGYNLTPQIFIAVPCSADNDNDDDGFVSASCGGDDCDDTNPNIYPTNPNTYCDCEAPNPQGTDETCGDGIDNDCSGEAEDKDQDGDGSIDEACGGGDCNDENPYIYSTNPNSYCDCDDPFPQGTDEMCIDGIDNDCNGEADDIDLDGDGHITAACGGDDCNDNNPDVHPSRPEIPYNNIDDDCNPKTPAYPETANTMAASHGRSSLIGSGTLNSLALLLLPLGAVTVLRILHRKR